MSGTESEDASLNSDPTGTGPPDESGLVQYTVKHNNDFVIQDKQGEEAFGDYFTGCGIYITPLLVAALGDKISLNIVIAQGSKWLNAKLKKVIDSSGLSVRLNETEKSFQLLILICEYIETIDPEAGFVDLPVGACSLATCLNKNKLVIATNKLRMDKLPVFNGSHKDWTVWSQTVKQQMTTSGFDFVFKNEVTISRTVDIRAGIYLQAALAKGKVSWIPTMVAADNHGNYLGTLIWEWLLVFL